MPRKKSVQTTATHFGERLTELRETAGLSQRQLARSSGVSQRMIAYYEARAAPPPGHVLSSLAAALALTVDEVLGQAPPDAKPKRSRVSQRILRRLQEMEGLPLKDKRELLNIIDTYLEKHRLAQRRPA